MKRQLLNFLLVGALLCASNSNANAADGTFGGGDGSSALPFLIEDAADLNAIRNNLTANYKLTDDIDLSAWITANSSISGWQPIGDATNYFRGNFDGNGKTISGLWIDRTTVNNIGLFGVISATTSEIKNVALSLDPKGIKGKENVAGIVGFATNSVNPTSVKIEKVAVLGNITGAKNGGGIIGYANWASVTLSNCYVKGEINVSGDAAGGLWAATWGSGSFNIINCYSICKVSANTTSGAAAGLIASVSASSGYPNVKLTISNSVAMSTTVSGSAASNRLLGFTKDATMAITCTNNNALAGTLVRGAAVDNGTATDKNGLSKTAKELAAESNYAAWDFDNVWTMSNGTYPFPILKFLSAVVQPSSFPSDAVYAYSVDVNTSVDGAGGAISNSVNDLAAGNNTTTITLTPDVNMILSSLLVNGEDKMADVANNQYTLTNIIADFAVVAKFSQATSISNVSDNKLHVYLGNEKVLFIENKSSELPVYVYDVAGRLLLTSKDSQINISYLPQGIYIIKVQNTITKITKG